MQRTGNKFKLKWAPTSAAILTAVPIALTVPAATAGAAAAGSTLCPSSGASDDCYKFAVYRLPGLHDPAVQPPEGTWHNGFITFRQTGFVATLAVSDGPDDNGACTSLQYRGKNPTGAWLDWTKLLSACDGAITVERVSRADTTDLQFRVSVPGHGTGALVRCNRNHDGDEACR